MGTLQFGKRSIVKGNQESYYNHFSTHHKNSDILQFSHLTISGRVLFMVLAILFHGTQHAGN